MCFQALRWSVVDNCYTLCWPGSHCKFPRDTIRNPQSRPSCFCQAHMLGNSHRQGLRIQRCIRNWSTHRFLVGNRNAEDSCDTKQKRRPLNIFLFHRKHTRAIPNPFCTILEGTPRIRSGLLSSVHIPMYKHNAQVWASQLARCGELNMLCTQKIPLLHCTFQYGMHHIRWYHQLP